MTARSHGEKQAVKKRAAELTMQPEAIVQTPDEALALLRQDPAEIGEETRKDETIPGVILIAPGSQRPL